MKKYDKKIIYDYIEGNDINNYNVDELEEDKVFMKSVIDLSGDENFYNLCGDNLKKDYEFVKYLVLKYKKNVDFVGGVADYFLYNTNYDSERMEIAIIMTMLTKNDKEKQYKYKSFCASVFNARKDQIEDAVLKTNDETVSKRVGMGFVVIYEAYKNNKMVLDFYALNMIKSIFKDNDIDLEELLHNQFDSKEEIDKIGINNYMLNLISNYDQMLSSYLINNIDLMSNLKSQIQKAQKNWDKYNDEKEREKYQTLFKKVHEYMELVDDTVSFSETDILYYIGKKLGIAEKILKYDYINLDVYEMLNDLLDGDYFENNYLVSDQDKFHYATLMKMISSIAFEEEKAITNIKKSDTKILKMKFKNKK